MDPHAIESFSRALLLEAQRAFQGREPSDWMPLQIDVALLPPDQRVIEFHAISGAPISRLEGLDTVVNLMRVPHVEECVAWVWLAWPMGPAAAPKISPPFSKSGWRPPSNNPTDSPSLSAGDSSPPVQHDFGFALDSQQLEELSQLSDEQLDARIDGNPQASLPRLARAWRRVSAHRWEEAISDFNRLIEEYPAAASLYLARAECYYHREEARPALDDYSRSIELQPTWPMGYFGRGQVYGVLRGWSAAEAEISEAIQRDGWSAVLFGHRALARWHLGRRREALADWDHAVRLDPYDFVALIRRIEFAAQSAGTADADEAYSTMSYVADLEHAHRHGPPHPHILTRLAEHRLEQGDPAAAMAFANQAIGLDQAFAPAWGVRGMAYYSLGDEDRAFADLTQALDLGAGSAVMYWQRASIHLVREEYESAIRDAEHALAIDADFALAYDVRGLARAAMSNLPGAEADLEKASELAPLWPLPLIHLGELRLEAKDHTAAREAFARAIECDPQFAQAWFQRGFCSFHEGDHEAAMS
ncbi:MAG TPA: tetratricopeptide repeat protein, partial [Pirellulaceae bacterium]